MTQAHDQRFADPVAGPSATRSGFHPAPVASGVTTTSIQAVPDSSLPPFPVIVGCPRSGTSLLALMLDGHPQLAIPPETSFLPRIMGFRGDPVSLRQRFFDVVTTDRVTVSNWSDFGLDKAAFQRQLDAIPAFTLAAGTRAFYTAYAESRGKRRGGDKTPGYVYTMGHIEALLPEARFIHVIRDPRDTVLSWRKTWFAPSQDLGVLGQHWRHHVEAGRRAGAALRHYLEVRFEDLIQAPERELRRVSAFIDVDFEAAMLESSARGEARLLQLQGRPLPDGRIVPREARTVIHANLTKPPLPDRVGVWRREMSDSEQRQVEAGVGPLFDAMGYGVPR